MRSNTPKVLHRIAGLSMLGHVLSGVSEAGADKVVVVVGPGRPDVSDEAIRLRPDAEIVVQNERLGTAHACLTARDQLGEGFDDVLVVFATGAYNAAMGSNYNRIPRPATVLVHDGIAELVQRREEPEDLLRYDLLPATVK